MIWIGVGLGLLFWIIDSCVDALVFYDRSLVLELFAPAPVEIWMRTTVLCLMIAFGVVAHVAITARIRAEGARLEQTRLLALDAEVGRILNRDDEFQALLQGCTEALVRHLDAAFARIWILNPNEQMLELQASAGMYTHLNGRHSRVAVGQFKIGNIAATKKPHLTNAVVGDPRVHDQEWAKREALVAFAGYPLVRGQEVFGVMALFSRNPLPELTLTMLATVADRITVGVERQRATEASHKLARHVESILASAGEGIYGLDRHGKMHFVNPAGAAMLGYEVEELLGAPMHETVHHTKADGSPYGSEDCPIYAAFHDGAVHKVDTEVFWRKDGTSCPVEYTSTPIWEQNQLAGAVVTFRDVTERQEAQEALMRSEHLLRSIINNTTAVIYVKWADGRYILINSQYEKLFNISQEQMRGRTDYDIFPKEIADAFRENDLKVLRTKGPIESEEDAPHEDGLHTYISVKFPLLDASGMPYATCGISTDITELKCAQDELRKSEAKRIEALQQSDALKSALLSSISHELRTPLTAIKSSVAALLGSGDGKNQSVHDDLLLGINYEVNALAGLVENLLDMSRIEAGAWKPQFEWHVFEELLEGALRQLSGHLRNRKLDLSVPPDLPLILLDALQIQQVLVNLLDNASKYSDEGSPIQVGARVQGKEMEVRVVSVGQTIPPGDVTRIFERFYRVPVGHQRLIRGSGLGLAICRSFVEAHGGRIWAESTPEKVTTITFTLPVCGVPTE